MFSNLTTVAVGSEAVQYQKCNWFHCLHDLTYLIQLLENACHMHWFSLGKILETPTCIRLLMLL